MSRYLWAVGEHAAAYQPGDTLADRYLCKGLRIFLDTKPALLPGSLDEVPEPFIPYLKLSPNQIHIPQIHDWIQPKSATAVPPVLLLDQAPLYLPKVMAKRGVPVAATTDTDVTEVQVLPELDQMWRSASPLRQLYWLWQMAGLWPAMQEEGVASSLLNPVLLRVEGPIIRLLELQFDRSEAVTLSALGEFWSNLAQAAHSEIQAPLQQLCQEMKQGDIRNAEAVINYLDSSIGNLEHSQQSCQIQIATLTDQGPSRQRNEDACYPASGTVTPLLPDAPLVIVCDGIGGHQGGDVASNLAIKSLEQQLKSLQPDRLDAVTLEVELEKAVGTANDLISQQNDSEQRFDRQRMGTTVVMGLIRGHELYVTHVGDSRAYWITRWGCHQITQDDDVASREVRLGYSSYPQALQQPSSGSLVQALGMGSAVNLYPTVQRFILDEDCVFLLCSDGLSDNDQVETHWEKVVLPLLDGRTDLGTVSRQWVDIGNHYNGYDNTTVGLVYCKIVGANAAAPQTIRSKTLPFTELPPTRPPQETALVSPSTPLAPQDSALSDAPTLIPTQRIDRPKQTRQSGQQSLLPLLAWVLLLSGIAAAIAAVFFWDFNQNPLQTAQTDSPSPQLGQSSSPASTPLPGITPGTEESIGSNYFRVDTSDFSVELNPTQSNQGSLKHWISRGSIVFKSDESFPDLSQPHIVGQSWVGLTVCSVSPETTQSSNFNEQELPASTPDLRYLKPGQQGWITLDFYNNLLDNSLKAIETSELTSLNCPSSTPVEKEITLPSPSPEQSPVVPSN